MIPFTGHRMKTSEEIRGSVRGIYVHVGREQRGKEPSCGHVSMELRRKGSPHQLLGVIITYVSSRMNECDETIYGGI